jgi:CheY-like chemotaxis protein
MSYVLIVQDCDVTAGLAIYWLEHAGYTAYAVPDSGEALAVLHDSTRLPCLILLDVAARGMDGVAFRSEQKRDPQLATIPVLAFSTYSNVLRYGAQHLFEGYLSIPFTRAELLAAVAPYYPQHPEHTLASDK